MCVMHYNNYKKARNAAWQILIDCHIKELPIKVFSICQRLQIQVKQDSNTPYSGYVKGVHDNIFICTNATEPLPRQRFTAAHELGHVVLGHVDNPHKTEKSGVLCRDTSINISTANPIEQEANVFAARILAPACVLWGINASTPEDIMRICNISREAAEYRAVRMIELYKRNKFLTSQLERRVYKQFQDYIAKNKL